MLQWLCNLPRPPSRLPLERLTRRSNLLTFAGRALTNGPLHPVVVGQPIGTLRNKVRAKPTARFPPCRPNADVSPLQVPAAAPSVKGVTLWRRVPGVGTQHHTSRHVRGPDARFGGMASPRRPPATIIDTRRAIRVEGSVQILLHHQKL